MITIKPNKYEGKRCFIVASGPSLKKVDLSRLKDEIVICVNESYKALPFDPTFMCIGDHKLWPKVKKKYAKMKNTGIIAGTGTSGLCGSEYEGNNLLALLKLDTSKTITKDGFQWDLQNKPIYKGWNVITEVVLPFLCYAGFDACYLLGADCKQNGYAFRSARGLKNQLIDDRIFPTYDKISTTRRPTRIYNMTEGSALNSFHRVSMDDILAPHRLSVEDYQVVGYYTPNNNYHDLAKRMQDSVIKQGFACDIYERPSLIEATKDKPHPMPWVMNCAQCASFCLTMYKKYPKKTILYLDADAVMEQYPTLLTSPDLPIFDMAVPFLDNEFVKNQLQGNTLIFRRTSTAKKILEKWVELTDIRIQEMLEGGYKKPYIEAWDQQILQEVVDSFQTKVFRLPWEYGKITVTPKGKELMEGVNPEDIVISQHQASRYNKYKVTEKVEETV